MCSSDLAMSDYSTDASDRTASHRREPASASERARTAAALHVAPCASRHRLVDVQPDRAGADRDRWYRRGVRSLGGEGVVNGDDVHPSRPDQERIRRTGGAKIAVTAAFHHEAEIMSFGKAHGRNDVGGALGFDRVGTRLQAPSIKPARALGKTRLIANVERISDELFGLLVWQTVIAEKSFSA